MLSTKYDDLKKEFPDEVIFFFDSQGKLNAFGKIAQELLECRKSNAE